ncbi:hypothetical protein P154DRAFT_313591 [Amniculicola lignicola CBS 123094]|uniref:Uncharacterized protein n=1 Tax=Amniculicola lignicola CBS 123094 TaxID=1392246 RepID=A0A6A5WUT6_9PLEO|nr:hypothetical protein P154DRAFT_313591 [Amniculicola lignicola CBS 123094]
MSSITETVHVENRTCLYCIMAQLLYRPPCGGSFALTTVQTSSVCSYLGLSPRELGTICVPTNLSRLQVEPNGNQPFRPVSLHTRRCNSRDCVLYTGPGCVCCMTETPAMMVGRWSGRVAAVCLVPPSILRIVKASSLSYKSKQPGLHATY